MKVVDRISELRRMMSEQNIDVYIVPSSDYHQSEYVGEHFKCREFMTGFTGSAGTAVFTMDEAGMWTDGRYFLQAEMQMEGTGVKLRKMGEPNVPTILEYIRDVLPENGRIGFDGRVVSIGEGGAYEKIAKEKNGSVVYENDFVSEIWKDRPQMSKEPVFHLAENYTGESTSSKLSRVRRAMKENNANVHVISTLDDTGWLFNIRGNDVEFFPLILSYSMVLEDKAILYIEESKVGDDIKKMLEKDGVELRPYNDIYEDIKRFGKEDTILLDPDRVNYALYNNISSDVCIVEKMNPTILFKAIKNQVEVENIKKAELKDSIAHCKFMYWIKNHALNEGATEMSASDKLESLRKEQPNYKWQSFAPISSFGPHAAIVHYESSEETDVKLEEGNFYLSDTGAGFMEGSTDITRTFAIGEVDEERKRHFTLVLRCNLGLARAKYLYGCTGANLDILCRQPLWDEGLNYNHGTGHGVGYLGNIHEPPSGIRWQFRPNEINPLEEGMIITNEPGLYIAGSHGIRLENEFLVRRAELTEYGQFMVNETITFVPFDLDAVLVDMLSERDKKDLNEYHSKVYELVSPHLNDDEREWLKKYTREV